jgi:hypothetical protein
MSRDPDVLHTARGIGTAIIVTALLALLVYVCWRYGLCQGVGEVFQLLIR